MDMQRRCFRIWYYTLYSWNCYYPPAPSCCAVGGPERQVRRGEFQCAVGAEMQCGAASHSPPPRAFTPDWLWRYKSSGSRHVRVPMQMLFRRRPRGLYTAHPPSAALQCTVTTRMLSEFLRWNSHNMMIWTHACGSVLQFAFHSFVKISATTCHSYPPVSLFSFLFSSLSWPTLYTVFCSLYLNIKKRCRTQTMTFGK